MSRYLVTGAAGFIGSHLTEALLDDGHEVIGVDAYTDYYARDLKERNLTAAREFETFAFVEADLCTVSLAPLTNEVDGIFHLAAQPGVRQSWGDCFGVYLKDNVHVTQRLLEAAAGRARVVFASSSSVYGEAGIFPTSEDVSPRPVSPYGVTKLTCEHLARTYASAAGLDVVCLRYFSVYGPRQRPVPEVREHIISAMRQAFAIGAPIAAGTDAGVSNRPFDSLPQELEVMVSDLGLSPLEAIHAATGEAARAIGVGPELRAHCAPLVVQSLLGVRPELRAPGRRI